MSLQPALPVDWLPASETVPLSRPTHQTVVGIDVACSGGRSDLLRMRADLRSVIATSLANQGLGWIHLHHDDLGDGVRLIVPAGISPSVMLDPFVPTIAQLLRGHRLASADTARLRLRIAVHMGLLHYDGHAGPGSRWCTRRGCSTRRRCAWPSSWLDPPARHANAGHRGQ